MFSNIFFSSPLSDLILLPFSLLLFISTGNQWNLGRWNGTGKDSSEYRFVGTLSRGEREDGGPKGFYSPHSSKTLCGIFSWLHHCFRLVIKHLKGSLFAPASFKGSPVSGFLQVLEHFNELVIWLHSSEELICQLFTFFSLTTPKAKKKKKKVEMRAFQSTVVGRKVHAVGFTGPPGLPVFWVLLTQAQQTTCCGGWHYICFSVPATER